MSNLRDRIRLEIAPGRLSEPFSVKQLKQLAEANAGCLGGDPVNLKHVNSVLAKFSLGPGTRRGESARAHHRLARVLSGLQPVGWPGAYKSVAAQSDANRLCKPILEVLNDPSMPESKERTWTRMDVGAVLFMAGY